MLSLNQIINKPSQLPLAVSTHFSVFELLNERNFSMAQTHSPYTRIKVFTYGRGVVLRTVSFALTLYLRYVSEEITLAPRQSNFNLVRNLTRSLLLFIPSALCGCVAAQSLRVH